MSEARGHVSSHSKRAGREVHRSRKGCPECRARKIKCDETRPECAQCLKNGRACGIIDGLFRPHSLSFPILSPRAEKSPKAPPASRLPMQENLASIWESSVPSNQPTSGGDISAGCESPQSPNLSNRPPAQSGKTISAGSLLVPASPPGNSHEAVGALSVQSSLSDNLSAGLVQDHPTVTSATSSQQSAIPTGLREESNQDCAEVGFFLRHFAESAGLWMDIATSERSYLSRYVVLLASKSPLLRYSACAIAAKQLGQMKDFTSSTDRTRRASITASTLLESGLDFLWYGAKYYEKAILLMTRQISHTPSSTAHLSPQEIYQSSSHDHHQLDEHDSVSSIIRILAACILCSYEDLSATMRAWSGHLDGINKLLRPHLDFPIAVEVFSRLPQPRRALETAFWYFALDDVLNSFVLRQPCRLSPDDFSLWQKMGLPLDNTGQFMLHCIDERYQETIFFKALIRLLCKLIGQNCGASDRWSHLDFEFSQWYHALPTEFLAPITQPLPPSQYDAEDRSIPETWFGSESCAIAMALYHMARILLLVNQPQEIFLAMWPSKPYDLLRTYNKLQRDLHNHAMEIISIAYGMPHLSVQKHLIQPLYIAGRCLSASRERQVVIRLLNGIENNFGFFTEYRIKDLFEEWGIPFEAMQER